MILGGQTDRSKIKDKPMPRPRFQNLPEHKRAALLEAAAKEFASHGYEVASLNRILELGGMSKGAAYYYFDDKADLFVTTVRHYTAFLVQDLNTEMLATAQEDFWAKLEAIYVHHVITIAQNEPWRYGVVRALLDVPPHVRSNPMIAALHREIDDIAAQMVAHGQQIGAIRTDLPNELLIRIVLNFDDTVDRWLLASLPTLPPAEQTRIVTVLARMLRGLLS
jgi:AcrR family transcriptional regulator